jgi:hypothetical protein
LPRIKKGLWLALKSNKILLILLPILLTTFVFGVIKLFMLRFEAGDIYPAYSSLRADPLGVKALYESLDNLQGLTVRRNYRPIQVHQGTSLKRQSSQRENDQETTFFFLGMHAEGLHFISRDAIQAFEALVADGGRLVFSFFPMVEQQPPLSELDLSCFPHRKKKKETKRTGETSQGTHSEKTNEKLPEDSGAQSTPGNQNESDGQKSLTEFARRVSLMKQWGFEIRYKEKPGKLGEAYSSATLQSKKMDSLPLSISWHTLLYFDRLHEAWQVIYAQEGQPVIVQRSLGRGTVILSADSYLFSNEALLRERRSQLLAWFIGTGNEVVFDEAHLGVRERPGIAALARRYRLHGLLAGVFLLVGLFIWKNSMSLIPPYDDHSTEQQAGTPTTKDYTGGLVSLLRRNISRQDILTVCFKEWKKSFARGREDLEDKLRQIQIIVDEKGTRSQRESDLVEVYRAICRILNTGVKES